MTIFRKSTAGNASPARVVTLAEREASWKRQDEELEAYCREPVKMVERPVTIDVPDLWLIAQGYSSLEKRGRRKSSARGPSGPKKTEPPAPRQLSSKDIDDLQFYFHEWPSVCGLRSSWAEQAEAMDECCKCGASFAAKSRRTTCPNDNCKYPRGSFHSNSYMRVASGGGSAWHPSYDAEMIGICNSGVVERANLVRDALLEMIRRSQSKMVNVLYLVYGEQNPFSLHVKFGNLAQIVGLTKAAEKACGGQFSRDALELVMRKVGGDDIAASVRRQAELLLIEAGEAYLRAK